MDQHQRNVPPPPPRSLASSATRQNPPPPPPRLQQPQLGQGQGQSASNNNMNASNKKMILFLVLTVSCVSVCLVLYHWIYSEESALLFSDLRNIKTRKDLNRKNDNKLSDLFGSRQKGREIGNHPGSKPLKSADLEILRDSGVPTFLTNFCGHSHKIQQNPHLQWPSKSNHGRTPSISGRC
eukprot:scaffold18869_cov33-Cyclotella_meneghiniana.AAC.1